MEVILTKDAEVQKVIAGVSAAKPLPQLRMPTECVAKNKIDVFFPSAYCFPVGSVTTCALLLVVLRATFDSWRLQRKLPPGPPGAPSIGNILQSPKVRAHLKVAKTYEGLYSLHICPATAAVITDRALVKELFDKWSALYSSRPASHVGQSIISRGDHLIAMDNSDNWHLFRKTINQHFSASMCEKTHVHLLEAEHTQMMRDFLLHPEKHTKRKIIAL
ncbi:uncharacterized protein BO87DRAFT_426401 [Aspergillus neoniger CBS 115656]|uniref:Cytochrome P450 n=1 Tax=Aspergillus neoniger (strain CBS 115656) TaxID=1448310 RepID=A0A318YHV1_ASPNB|nr:hypothetical protein BO87DRAFT_426401 [Aspergillus neoniger CBS 115656]PYH33654.1 hypothetical protein BO87DRAFT_426401 [Aspergillus neoniger CBS 115656]